MFFAIWPPEDTGWRLPRLACAPDSPVKITLNVGQKTPAGCTFRVTGGLTQNCQRGSGIILFQTRMPPPGKSLIKVHQSLAANELFRL